MFAKVAKEPTTKADDAYREVVTEFEDRFREEEQVWNDAISSLTNKEHLARNMRHTRNQQHGPQPKNRNEFDAESVVAGALGGRKVIIMDSDKNLDADFYKELHAFETNAKVVDDEFESFASDEGEPGEASNDGSNSTESFESLDPSLDGSVDEPPESSNTKKPRRIITYSTVPLRDFQPKKVIWRWNF